MSNRYTQFLTKKYTEHPIDLGGGAAPLVMRFYPISVRRFSSLQDVVKIVSKSIDTLFTKGNSFGDFKSVSRTFGKDAGHEEITEPADVAVIALRQKQRSQAIDDVITALMHEDNLKTTCQLIMDSAREFFEKDDDVEEFLDKIDMELLPQFIEGLGKGNKKVFAPLMKRLGINLEAVKERFRTSLDTEPTPMPEEPSSTPSEEATTEPVAPPPPLTLVAKPEPSETDTLEPKAKELPAALQPTETPATDQ